MQCIKSLLQLFQLVQFSPRLRWQSYFSFFLGSYPLLDAIRETEGYNPPGSAVFARDQRTRWQTCADYLLR